MTPIQQAIEQVKKDIIEYTKKLDGWNGNSEQGLYSHILHQLSKTLNHLQSLLPVEKEWAQDVFEAGYNSGRIDYSTHKAGQTFEQYYSQFNEVK